jgi:hypothetical protein
MHRVELSSNTITHWPITSECYGLSVTTEYTLLLSLQYVNSIQEYATQGKLLRDITFDSSLTNPSHCIRLANNNYVLCHTRAMHRMCIVDSSGQILQSYGGTTNWNAQLCFTMKMAVDNCENLLIADFSNCKLRLLSHSLASLSDIPIDGYKMTCIRSMHLDAANGRLYIGDQGKGNFFVLKPCC